MTDHLSGCSGQVSFISLFWNAPEPFKSYLPRMARLSRPLQFSVECELDSGASRPSEPHLPDPAGLGRPLRTTQGTGLFGTRQRGRQEWILSDGWKPAHLWLAPCWNGQALPQMNQQYSQQASNKKQQTQKSKKKKKSTDPKIPKIKKIKKKSKKQNNQAEKPHEKTKNV